MTLKLCSRLNVSKINNKDLKIKIIYLLYILFNPKDLDMTTKISFKLLMMKLQIKFTIVGLQNNMHQYIKEKSQTNSFQKNN